MTISPMQHLSEEELDDVLLGVGTAESELHLAACEVCSAQLAPFQTSVAAFNEGSLAWAQAKSNTVSRDLSAARLSTGHRQPLAWAAGVSSLAAIAFVLAINLHHAPEVAENNPPPAAHVSVADNAQEIAADNAMLEAINSEISSTAPSPLQPFRNSSTRLGDSHHSPAREVRD